MELGGIDGSITFQLWEDARSSEMERNARKKRKNVLWVELCVPLQKKKNHMLKS